MLGQIEAETQTALDDLRDLARGIYPPLLADKGLGSALDAQARKAPFPVQVDADGVGRLPQDVEAAVYFSCLEALQNVAKYAQASNATIDSGSTHRRCASPCRTTGCGFDPSCQWRPGAGCRASPTVSRRSGERSRSRASREPARRSAGRVPIRSQPDRSWERRRVRSKANRCRSDRDVSDRRRGS